MEVVDARGTAVIPGLINAHTHGHGGLSKGCGDRWTLEMFLAAGGWVGGSRTPQDCYVSTQLAAVEMLLKGCTACFDLSLAAPIPDPAMTSAAGMAYRDAGMRAVVAPMVGDIPFVRAVPGLIDAIPSQYRPAVEAVGAADCDALLRRIESIIRAWDFPADTVRLGLAPTIPLHSTDAFFLGSHRLAREHGLVLQTHLAESRVQAASALARWGMSTTEHLAHLGVLDERFSAAHGVWLDEADMRILGAHGASLAHNPGSNLRLGSGIADIRAHLLNGINVGIGTDGGASADGQNMFEATRLACNLSRVQGRAPDQWVSAAEALERATIGSAQVLGFQGLLGRIAPGFKADLVFLDLACVHYVPLNDLVNQIVHVEDGSAIKRVMVGGRVVVDSGRVLTVDVEDLVRRATLAGERLRSANRHARLAAMALEPHIACHCQTLMARPWSAGAPASRHLGFVS
jgi:5-methylthioadenosine/S-adenosylhomocysteine deaminase